MQKSVWVNAGEGDDRVIDRNGKAILTDKTESVKADGETSGQRNDTATHAFDLGTITSNAGGDPTFVQLTIDNPEDVDWYKFRLAAMPTAMATITVASLNTEEDKFTFEIYEDPNDLSSPKANGDFQVSLDGLVTGKDYWLKISDNLRPTIYDIQFNLDGDAKTTNVIKSFETIIDGPGSTRRDVLLGGPGDDVLSGGGGEDWIFGGPGTDVLTGGKDRGASDLLFGGEGNDTFQIIPDFLPSVSGPLATFFDGEAATELLTTSDQFRGGDGFDRVLFLGGDKDRLFNAVPDIVAIKYNTVLHRWEFASGVWDIGKQQFQTNEDGSYRQQFLFYQTRDVESTVIATRAGDDVVHADAEFNVRKDDGKLTSDDTPLFAGNWGIAEGK